MCDTLHYPLDNMVRKYIDKLYVFQWVLIVLLLLQICFCYERAFMLSLSYNNLADVIEAFNSTSRYLDDLLNIDNPYFEQMIGQIYPTELQLKRRIPLILNPYFWTWTCP